jgi:hypothetical protein
MEIGLDGNDKNEKLFLIAKDLVFEINFFKRLQGVKILIKMLDESQRTEIGVDSFFQIVNPYIEDDLFMRQAKLISVIADNPETAIEYYGKDYLNGIDFLYRKTFEDKKKIVDDEINSLVGKAINIMIKGENLDFI